MDATDRNTEVALADAEDALRRVVANESNHYDRYWTPPDESVSDEWLDATEAKMRDALEDVFCDDAAAVMLTLIAEIRRQRTQPHSAWVQEGWWHPNVTRGIVHDHNPGQPMTMHLLCEPVFTNRGSDRSQDSRQARIDEHRSAGEG